MKKSVKEKSKQFESIKCIYRLFTLLRKQFGMNIISITKKNSCFLKEYKAYSTMANNKNFSISWKFFQPYLQDRIANTPLEPVYFYQDTWAARKLFELEL